MAAYKKSLLKKVLWEKHLKSSGGWSDSNPKTRYHWLDD